MTEYDDLERQLRGSVRALGAGTAAAGDSDAQRRTRRRWLGFLAVPAVLVAGAAGAAGLAGGPGTEEAADRLVRAAVSATREVSACGGDLRVGVAVEVPDRAPVDDPPLPQIARSLPALAAPPARSRAAGSDALATARRIAAGAAVLRRTVRVARFADGGRVLVFVSTAGGPLLRAPDRTGCLRARREHVLGSQRRTGAADDDPVTARALVLLADQRDTAPGAQTVWLSDLASRASGPGGTGTTGMPVTPRGDAPSGVALTGGIGGRRRIVGIAHPRAVRMVVRPAAGSPRAARTRLRRAVTRRFRIDQGVFAFTEPWPGAGPLVLVQYDAADRVVARRRLRA